MSQGSGKAFEKARRAYEKAATQALRDRVKGTSWKKRDNSVFRQAEPFFFAAFFDVWLNEDKVAWRLEAKPISLDPVFWTIMDMQANEKEPLSLRAWGAFVCDAVPIAESVADPALSADQMVQAFLTWAGDAAGEFAKEWRDRAFSELVRSHENHRARGAYAATLVTALIVEGRIEDAARTAEEFSSGARTAAHQQVSQGRSFFERAVVWIEAQRSRTP